MIILADNDEPGRKHAEKKAALFARTARSRARPDFPRSRPSGRCHRLVWTPRRHGRALWERVEQAPTWAPGPEPENKTGANEDLLQPIFDPWEDYPVPPFPLDILPPGLERFVIEDSRVIGCDPSALAMSVLGACSGALSHEFRLKLMRHRNGGFAQALDPALRTPATKKNPGLRQSAQGDRRAKARP